MTRPILLVAALIAMLATPVRAVVFDSEERVEIDGHASVLHFLPGVRSRPLIVLAPGGGATARIFYGVHPDHRPAAFLATHLNAFGYNVLSVTTPIATADPIFDTHAPGFTVRNWGQVLAGAAKLVVEREGITGGTILAGWSMAGKAAQSMAAASRAIGTELDLFVSLSATPPILGLLGIESGYPMDQRTGYGQAPDPEYKGALWNIRQNARANGVDEIIPGHFYISHYVGEGPVGLSHTGIRWRDGKIIQDLVEDIGDGQGFDFESFPMTATIIPTTRHDMRHGMTDLHTWGMILTNHLYRAHVQKAREQVQQMSGAEYGALRELVMHAPSRLSETIDGNHFFFLGEIGARQTAEAIARLEAEAAVLRADLAAMLVPEVEAPDPEGASGDPEKVAAR